MQISVWEAESFFASQDVVIIGGGFVGLWSALTLKQRRPHLKVTLVDRGVVPTGASGRNAGFACFGSPTELLHDAEVMGWNALLTLVHMRFSGLQRIQQHFSAQQIGYEQSGGYELMPPLANKKNWTDQIQDLNTQLQAITGSPQTFSVVANDTFGFGNTSFLIKTALEGGLHSGLLLQQLTQQVQALGVQIFTGTAVEHMEQSNRGWTLHTNHHFTLYCSQVLVCTNAFARELLPELEVAPARGQVLLTAPIPNLHWQGTFHAEEGYYYFRNLGNRVLLGGARHTAFEAEATTHMHTTESLQQRLEDYLTHIILPKQSYTIERRWSGIMGMGPVKGPILQQVKPQLYCAVRMSGMGVALAPEVAQQVCTLMGY